MNFISVAYLTANAGVSTRLDTDETVLHISGDGGTAFLVEKRIKYLYVCECVDVYSAGAPGIAVEVTLAAEEMQELATIDVLHSYRLPRSNLHLSLMVHKAQPSHQVLIKIFVMLQL